MYKIKLWDEDKWNIHSNIHSSSYNSSKYENLAAVDKGEKAYHEQKYGSEGKSTSSDYLKKEEDKSLSESDNAKIQDLPEFSEDEQKIWQKAEEEELPFKAAKQIFSENKNAKKSAKHGLSDAKADAETIEDAIKKAIEEEKKVIIMDS